MSPKAERLYKQALAAQAQNDPNSARQHLEDAIRWAPHPDLYLAYAALAERGGGIDRAIAVVQGGIKRFPLTAPLYVSYASLLRLRDRVDDARTALRKGLNRAPGSAPLNWALASLLVDIGDERDFATAARHARRAEQLGLTEIRDDPRYQTLRFATASALGRQTVQFFRVAGFDLRVERLTAEYADLTVQTQQPAYTDGYGLSRKVLVRCFLREVADWGTFLQLAEALTAPPYADMNQDVAFAVLRDATGWHNALYRLIGDSHEAIVPLDLDTLAQESLHQVLDRWLSRRNLFDDRFPVSARQFFGRELELRQLRGNIDEGRHTGIYGLRKVGKTSLLYQLRETRPHDLVVYVDLQEICGTGQRDCAYLYWAIGRRLHELLAGRPTFGPELADTTLRLEPVMNSDHE